VRRSTLTSAVVTALAVAAIAPTGASAATRSHSSARAGEEAFATITGQPRGRVHVAVKIKRFVATASGPKAKGIATATLRSFGAAPTTVRQKVTLAVTRRGRCNILTLVLNQLDLTLLGLNVHLDKVVLRVTGQRRGGILGRLFCSLAGARTNLAKASRAAHRLNVRMTRRSMTPLSLTVPISARTAQASNVCRVLNLVLGPLHLNLLGLVIDLNRVHLRITAIRGGGLLGDLFCGLANTPVPTPTV
jgi:hypothetical protein